MFAFVKSRSVEEKTRVVHFDKSLQEKVVLSYSLIYYKMAHQEPSPTYHSLSTFVDSHLAPHIIYYDPHTDTYLFHGDRLSKNARIFGFFVYHSRNKRAYIYEWADMSISLANNVDEYDILEQLRRSHDSALEVGNTKPPWGLMIYSSRYRGKHNGMVVKIVDPRDKLKKRYAYPPGPGVIANDPWPGGVNRVSSKPHEFLTEEFHNKLDPQWLEELRTEKSRITYSIVIELCIRDTQRILSQERAWMTYV